MLFEAGDHLSCCNLQISQGGSAKQPLVIDSYGDGSSNRSMATLMGGALQLIAASQPEFLLLDEPHNGYLGCAFGTAPDVAEAVVGAVFVEVVACDVLGDSNW